MYMHIQWECALCSVCIVPNLQSLCTSFLPADGTATSQQLASTANHGSTVPSSMSALRWASQKAQKGLICFTDWCFNRK